MNHMELIDKLKTLNGNLLEEFNRLLGYIAYSLNVPLACKSIRGNEEEVFSEICEAIVNEEKYTNTLGKAYYEITGETPQERRVVFKDDNPDKPISVFIENCGTGELAFEVAQAYENAYLCLTEKNKFLYKIALINVKIYNIKAIIKYWDSPVNIMREDFESALVNKWFIN